MTAIKKEILREIGKPIPKLFLTPNNYIQVVLFREQGVSFLGPIPYTTLALIDVESGMTHWSHDFGLN